jgi:ADP-ribosylglycohydrolase
LSRRPIVTQDANSPPLPNSYWVLPGQLLAGEHPGSGRSREETRSRLKRLLASGIECFVDLTQPSELERYDVELPIGVEYLRKPIKDHAVPDQRAHMAEILDCLHDALQSGRKVYVHCRAGIGRTGTVVGCFLVECGREGEAALEELNRAFQQSERSKSWDWVPETKEQNDFVRKWTPRSRAGAFEAGGAAGYVAEGRGDARASGIGLPRGAALRPAASSSPMYADGPPAEIDPLLDPATLSAAQGLRSRFHGALLGLAVGDALAAATQFRKPGTFGAVGDLLGGGPFDLPRGGWSDDTAMTLCLAESLLECDGFDARDQVERYQRWQRQGYLSATGQCLGITASTARALAMAQWRRQAFSGSHDPAQLDPEPLSRVAAATLFFMASGEQGDAWASEAARTTCQAPVVLEACRVLSLALRMALTGQPKAAVIAALSSAQLAPGAGQLAPGSAQLAQGPAQSAGSLPTGTAPEALAAATWAFSTTDNFRDAVLRAVNLGGNSDIAAAVCGQVAGAHYSISAIPASWRNSLMQKELIENTADRLLAHAMLGLGG